MAQTRSYDQYLTRIAGMIGMPVSGMTTDELGFLNAYFNNNVRSMWQLNCWLDVCPFGEARFAGNVLHYTNDISQTSYWTPAATTVTRNTVKNPLDGRVTACTLAETATTSIHGITQPITPLAGASYTFSTYARPIGGRWLFLSVFDGVGTYSGYFDLINGVAGTASGLNSNGATIQLQASGFYLCTINYTVSASASSGTVSIQSASDGSTTSFLGSASAGLYLWGNLLIRTTQIAANEYNIPFDQEGETVIDAVFDVFQQNPNNPPYPRSIGYNFTPSGIQLIPAYGYNANYYGAPVSYTSPTVNPVFVYYRAAPNDYLGAAYNALTAYAASTTVLFTSPTTSVQNYYMSVIATSAGQSPESVPANWQLVTIYDVFFQYACYAGYADWLRQDGQFDKASNMDGLAQKQMDDEADRMERQQGHTLPLKVSTHVTSQARY